MEISIDVYKIILIGDAGVGKTLLAQRLANLSIYDKVSAPTIGLDIIIRNIEVNNKLIKLYIWDTAGQERFNFITTQYYRYAKGIIMVYDVTNLESYEHLKKWLKIIKDNSVADEKPTPKLLIGNKIDKINRKVDYDIAKKFADNNHMQYYEISAYEDTNYNDILECVINQIDLDNNQIPKKITINNIKQKNYCCSS